MPDVAAEPPSAVSTQAPSAYDQAVRDRLAGRNAQAVSALERRLAERPDDVDARLNLGLALLALGRLDEADAAFARVLSDAPSYADAELGRARVAARRGDAPGAQAAADRAARLGADAAEVAALRASLSAPVLVEPRWRVDLWAAESRLTRDLPSWKESGLAVSRAFGDRRVAGLSVERTERFGREDVFVEARVETPVAGAQAYVALGGAPDADHRPELSLRAGGRIPIGDASWTFTVDGAVARYPVGTVTSLHPGIEKSAFGLTLTARWINVWDEAGDWRSGYAAAARWQAHDRLALRLGYADAPESSDGATVDVQALDAGVEVGLTDNVTLRVTAVHEAREGYDRDQLGLGLGWRF